MAGELPDNEGQFVLGVDLDGVVADYLAGFTEYLTQRGRLTPEAAVERSRYDFSEWGLTHDDYESLHAEAVVQHRLLARLPAIEGGAEALWRLSDAGVWIRVITHRLYVNWGHAEAVGDTVLWLDEHSIPYRDICFLGNKPDVGADCYIDDAPHNVHALRAGGSDVIVFAQSYNTDLADPRARTWAEVYDMVMERFVRWRGPRGVQPQFPGLKPDLTRLERQRSRR